MGWIQPAIPLPANPRQTPGPRIRPLLGRSKQGTRRRNRRRKPMPRLRSRSLLAQPPGPESAANKKRAERRSGQMRFQARATAPSPRRNGDRRYIPCPTRANRRQGAPPHASKGPRIAQPTWPKTTQGTKPNPESAPGARTQPQMRLLKPHPAQRPAAAARRGAAQACFVRMRKWSEKPFRADSAAPPKTFMHPQVGRAPRAAPAVPGAAPCPAHPCPPPPPAAASPLPDALSMPQR